MPRARSVPLSSLHRSRAVDRAVRVLSALASLSNDHSANQLAIAKVGGIPPVITWLSSTSEEAQREAAHAVLAIAANNVTTQVCRASLSWPTHRHFANAFSVPRALAHRPLRVGPRVRRAARGLEHVADEYSHQVVEETIVENLMMQKVVREPATLLPE